MKKDEINARVELAEVLGRLVLLGVCVQIMAARVEWLECGTDGDACTASETFTLPSILDVKRARLHAPHALKDLGEFLDRRYDAGYGGQRLDGVIWLTDGTWLTRGENDGSEWWEHHECPTVPRR